MLKLLENHVKMIVYDVFSHFFFYLGLIFEYFDQKVPEKSIFAKNLSTLGISELLVDPFFQVQAKFNSKIN